MSCNFTKIGDDIAITGMSGRFPSCDNVDDFKRNLLDGTDMVVEDESRWPRNTLGLHNFAGKMKNLNHFDASFFGVNNKQVEKMDPELRFLLEITFETLVDAGVNPNELRGSNTGVFIGAVNADAWENLKGLDSVTGYECIGCSRSMLANRISYCFDFKGPSFSVDSACSSSLHAMHLALMAMKTGQCDAALVGGCNILLCPHGSLQFRHLNVFAKACRSFDRDAYGYVRSEACAMIFLQKVTSAKRIYATVVASKMSNDGYKIEGPTFPASAAQRNLLREIYKEAGVDPNEVVYVETHGTGTLAGDPQEANAVADVLCENRRTPLYIGTVKSNMGHSEAASGICSIIKVIIAMESGIIPANLNYVNANPGIAALLDGRMKVVTENMPWNGGLVGITNIGFGGSNSHLILKSHPKSKDKHQLDTIPRIIQVSGRTESAVNYLLDELNANRGDKETLALVNSVFSSPISRHYYRGFNVAGGKNHREIFRTFDRNRPVWFVYTGMACEWEGMGKELFRLDTFRNSIRKCSRYLKLDLENVVTNSSNNFDLLNVFPAITAMQIALTDVLRVLGIKPDGIIGFSMGEIASAYADGCLTAEQAILTAHERGKITHDSHLTPGVMASVGLSWTECQKRCPADVFPACNVGPDNVTISGPKSSIEAFISELSSENIFARMLNTYGVAFHSKYVKEAALLLKKNMSKIIPSPKTRSSKWLSSSVPESLWTSREAQLCSADYYVNNYLSPVLFYDALLRIPENAVVVEIAPHAILQTVFKRSLGPGVAKIGLINKFQDDVLQSLLTNIGRLYNVGCQSNIANLYESIDYPVSRGTRTIGSMIRWDHSTECYVPLFKTDENNLGTIVDVDIDVEDNKYLQGHVLDNKIILPFSGYLVLIWKLLARTLNKSYEDLGVIFTDARLHKMTDLTEVRRAKFLVNIFKSSGNFEISQEGTTVFSGKIHLLETFSPLLNSVCKSETISSDSIYTIFNTLGYNYGGIFQGINEFDISGRMGTLLWNNNWTAFLENVVQFFILGEESQELLVPVAINKITIDPLILKGDIIKVYRHMDAVVSEAMELEGVQTIPLPRICPQISNLEKILFFPYGTSVAKEEDDVYRVTLQILQENFGNSLEIVEINLDAQVSLFPQMQKAVSESKTIRTNFGAILAQTDLSMLDNELGPINSTQNLNGNSANLILGHCDMENHIDCVLVQSRTVLKPDGFILLVQNFKKLDNGVFDTGEFQEIFSCMHGDNMYRLLRKSRHIDEEKALIIQIDGYDLSWLEYMESDETENLYFVCQDDSLLISGYSFCKPNAFFYILNTSSEIFSFTSPTYAKQLRLGLRCNEYKGGVWGSYRTLPLDNTGHKVVEHAFMECNQNGDLQSFQWMEMHPNYSKKDMVCWVYFCPMKIGTIGDSAIAFAGRDSNGSRVMGIAAATALVSSVAADSSLLWAIPDNWSLAEAATVPAAYAVNYFSLNILGSLRNNNYVLIMDGVTPMSQAAIRIATSFDCQVFTTTNSEKEQKGIRELFPTVKNIIICDSEKLDWNRKFDVILSNPRYHKKQGELMRYLVKFGRFICVGRIDNLRKPLDVNMSVHEVNAGDLLGLDTTTKNKISEFVADGISSGLVQPLPFSIAERFQTSDMNNNQIPIVQVREETVSHYGISAIPKICAHHEMCYVLIGNIDVTGLEIANWLVLRRARKLILCCGGPISTDYQRYKIHRWRKMGVEVLISSGDASSLDGANALVRDAAKLGDVGGIFYITSATDSFIKINTVRHLDIISRSNCISLEYFVCILICNPSDAQEFGTNLPNEIVKKVCDSRYCSGLPGKAILLEDANGDFIGVFDKLLQEPYSILSASTRVGNTDVWSNSKNNKEKNIVDIVSKSLNINEMDSMDPNMTLIDFGIDSIITVEITQSLMEMYGMTVTAEELKRMNITALRQIDENMSK